VSNQVWASGFQGLTLLSATPRVAYNVGAQDLKAIAGSGPADLWTAGARGALARFDGSNWTMFRRGETATIRKVAGSAPDDLWAVLEPTNGGGFFGKQKILRRSAAGWTLMTLDVETPIILDVWVRSKTEAWAVGDGGLVLRWNGTTWSKIPSGTSHKLYAVSGASTGDVVFVGNLGTHLRYDGSSIVAVPGLQASLRDVAHVSPTEYWITSTGSQVVHVTPGKIDPKNAPSSVKAVRECGANNVMFVGNNGSLRRWNGTAFQNVGPQGGYSSVVDVSCRDASDVLVARFSDLRQWNGTSDVEIPTPSPITPTSVRAVGNDVWLAGTDGMILRKAP
jgi:trimeric autotransporter adhesin